MQPTTVTVITGAFALIKDLSYVGLFAYGIRQAFTYAGIRLRTYGVAGDYFPQRDETVDDEIEEEVLLKRGTKDAAGQEKQIGFRGLHPVTGAGGESHTGRVGPTLGGSVPPSDVPTVATLSA